MRFVHKILLCALGSTGKALDWRLNQSGFLSAPQISHFPAAPLKME